MIEIHPDIREFFEKKFDTKITNNNNTITPNRYWFLYQGTLTIYIAAYYPDNKEMVYSIDNFHTTEYTEAEMLKIIKIKAFL